MVCVGSAHVASASVSFQPAVLAAVVEGLKISSQSCRVPSLSRRPPSFSATNSLSRNSAPGVSTSSAAVLVSLLPFAFVARSQ